jgi:hypothetical protein
MLAGGDVAGYTLAGVAHELSSRGARTSAIGAPGERRFALTGVIERASATRDLLFFQGLALETNSRFLDG